MRSAFRGPAHQLAVRMRIASMAIIIMAQAATARAPRVCTLINPWRACAARVTVVVLSFCLSVCLSVCYHAFCRYIRAIKLPISDTNGFSATLALFLKPFFL